MIWNKRNRNLYVKPDLYIMSVGKKYPRQSIRDILADARNTFFFSAIDLLNCLII